jgi:5-methylcytosine-specific restriction endonuclease McrA
VLGDNPTCVYCGENPANQVDHINSLKRDWESGGWSDEQAVRMARVNDPGNLTGVRVVQRVQGREPDRDWPW